MYRNAADVAADLAVDYSGPTKEKGGFTYIPAAESQKTLDRLFGPLGWSEEGPVITADPEHGIYVAAERIVAHVVDETGTVREVGRVGFGRAIAQATTAEREQGLTVTNNLQLHDVAAAAAGTDAFSRGCKKFGPALGSNLYAGDHEATAAKPAYKGTPKAGQPSPKQFGVLIHNGFTKDDINAMDTATWRGHLDRIMGKSNEAPF